MNDIAVLNALAASLESLARALQPTIDSLDAAGTAGQARAQEMRTAQADYEAAAKNANNAAAKLTLAGDASSKLVELTGKVQDESDAIDAREHDVARAVGIAAKVLDLGHQLAGGNVLGAAGTASALTTLLG